MKPRFCSLLFLFAAVFLLTGCACTYIHRDEKGATAFRGSLGTDQSVGELTLEDGNGAKASLKRYLQEQSVVASKAIEAATAR